jgi:hypothetical protein
LVLEGIISEILNNLGNIKAGIRWPERWPLKRREPWINGGWIKYWLDKDTDGLILYKIYKDKRRYRWEWVRDPLATYAITTAMLMYMTKMLVEGMPKLAHIATTANTARSQVITTMQPLTAVYGRYAM